MQRTLCRDFADVLDISAAVNGDRLEDETRHRELTKAFKTIKRTMTPRDAAQVSAVLDSYSAEAQQGRAYMSWVSHVLNNLETTWCEDAKEKSIHRSSHKKQRRSASRTPRPTPRSPPRSSSSHTPLRSPRIARRLFDVVSPRKRARSPSPVREELVPVPPKEPRNGGDRQRMRNHHRANQRHYWALKGQLKDSAQKNRDASYT